MARNNLASAILGRDGTLTLMCNIVTKLAKNQYGPRLKVAAEALSNLTKTRQNQLLLTKQNFVQDLVHVFRQYEHYLDRGRMTVKVAGALLYIFQHLVGSSKCGVKNDFFFQHFGNMRFLQKLASNSSWRRAASTASKNSLANPYLMTKDGIDSCTELVLFYVKSVKRKAYLSTRKCVRPSITSLMAIWFFLKVTVFPCFFDLGGLLHLVHWKGILH